jgi:hypothetical protein
LQLLLLPLQVLLLPPLTLQLLLLLLHPLHLPHAAAIITHSLCVLSVKTWQGSPGTLRA